MRLLAAVVLMQVLAVVVVGGESTQMEATQGSTTGSFELVTVECPTGAICDDPLRPPLHLGDHEHDCPPGYGLAVTDSGSYEAHKTYVCYPCQSGYYSKGLKFPCEPCGSGDGFGSPTGAAHPEQCFCLPGYGGRTCTLCQPGTFSPGGTLEPCCRCPNGANTTEGATSAEFCGCPPGRGGPTCDICPVGTFGLGGTTADGTGNTDCESCPGGNSTTTVLEGSKSQAACVCAPGYAGPSCTACTADQICPGGSRDPPLRCPGGPASKPAPNALTLQDCECNAGYGRVESKTSCDGCGFCELCPPGSYSGGGFGACVKCLPGYTSPAGSTGSNNCTLCPAGKFEQNGLCLKCPVGTSSKSTTQDPPVSEAACDQRTCALGFGAQSCQGGNDGSCVECAPCPPGTYSDDYSFSGCKTCDPGYTSLPGSTASSSCQKCPSGTYEENGICLPCPVGSSSGGGGRGAESCVGCLAGFGLQPCPGKQQGCVSCQPCPEGTYQDSNTLGGYLATCQQCPVGMTSNVGATDKSKCFCKYPGYGIAGTAPNQICLPCDIGFWSVGGPGVRAGCTACGSNQITLGVGAVGPQDCLCAAGYGGPSCTACTYPFYQGYLDENLVPRTSATKENPKPPCLKCNVDSPMKVGSATRQCLTTGSTTPAVYCVNNNNPAGDPFCSGSCIANAQWGCAA